MKNHGNGQFFDKADGNHRVVQPVNTQDPVIITDDATGLKEIPNDYQTLFIAFLILFILALIAFGVACCLYIRSKSGGVAAVPLTSIETEMHGK